MGENSLKNRFERVCDQASDNARATKDTLNELKYALGYMDNFWISYMGLRRNTITAPPVSVAERLSAIEAYLGIEVTREPGRIVAKKKAKEKK